jgi:glycosyltransferase involved in cell wall biosynthesis
MLYRDPALRAEMGRNGRQHAEQDYSKQVVTRRYHELFSKVR